ncbi:MAG: hypothetical protein ACQETA_03345 [Bacteroidota bacterium]
MPQKPNKLVRLWRELKHRRVFRVVTIYAATSYIIIELVNNLVEPLFLPDWTATLIVILLISGLPVVVVLSWIYDISPEGIIRTESKKAGGEKEPVSRSLKRKIKANDIAIAALLLIVVVLVWPKVFTRDKVKTEKNAHKTMITAVMPFQNMTDDTNLNKWQAAIQNDITASLSNSFELQVKPVENVNKLLKTSRNNTYYPMTASDANRTAHKLRAEMYVTGSIKQSGSQVRLNAQLCLTKSNEDVRSFQIDGTKENILNLIDTLSYKVKNFLVIYQLQKEVPSAFRDLVNIKSYQEYSFFAYGYRAMLNFDYQSASERFARVVEADSMQVFAYLLLSLVNARQELYDEAKNYYLCAYQKRKDGPPELDTWYDYVYALLFEDPQDQIRSLKQLEEYDDMRPEFYYYKGSVYNNINQYDRAVTELEKAVVLYEEQDNIQSWSPVYSALGLAYYKNGQLKKERKLYKKAIRDFPGDVMIIQRQAIQALSDGNSREAGKYLRMFRSLCMESLLSESETLARVAGIYFSAGIHGQAERYYREALTLDPGNPEIMNRLASHLIENDMDIIRGMELVDSALATDPGNYMYLHTRGRGLFKLGRYPEALKLLEKSWELKPVYDHELFLHLEEAREASN